MVRALTAALAASLLVAAEGSGAETQTPKRGGTARVGSPVAEPACLNVLLATCDGDGRGTRVFADEVLASPFDVGPDNAYRKSLVSDVDVTTTPPVHAHLPHPPRGSVERPGADHRRATSSSPTKRMCPWQSEER